MFPMIAGYVMGTRAANRAAALGVVSNHRAAGGSVSAVEAPGPFDTL
jgi:hypothetical protein